MVSLSNLNNTLSFILYESPPKGAASGPEKYFPGLNAPPCPE